MVNKLKIVNDPVHGFIKIPHEILFDVIEHPYFQRLRRISQTGLLSLVYPGAMHTRFHHALGATHLMFTALETLKMKGIDISQEEEKAALLAILLHDVGHGPYSHALESVLMNDCHHERLSILLMEKLNEEFNGQLALAIQMFQGKYHRKFFNQLVSSQLDVDRLDYLKRDSFYTGVTEGNVNTQRIISMMNVHDDELVIDAKGIYSIENFLTARMFMYWQVYFHKTSAVAEHLLIKVLKRAKELSAQGENLVATENLSYFLTKNKFDKMTEEDLKRFTEMDDSDIMFGLKNWQYHSDFVLSRLCKSVTQRHFPKNIISEKAFGKELVENIIQKTNDFYGIDNASWLVDEIERSLLPYDTNKQPIFLKSKSDLVFPLEASENQILTQHLKTPTTKYILSFPREVLPVVIQDLKR
ncbi:phosphohydrolase [Elizabethkingia meningoseptica]|uniref:HD domain-containing protein n=1 Tax=Elizabethkingia meningoseptica TaxID=238 RepID=UPI0009993A01|nr:HD domain-containing protein [Elizabethkingia meningoseptica]MEC4712025.1 HD domain-containing protein [Elizabethkingia meningoseptica]OPC30456.1 phosphohydrolase [Elizabethkingia meningoseptica]